MLTKIILGSIVKTLYSRILKPPVLSLHSP